LIGVCAVFLFPSYLDIFSEHVNAHPHAVAFLLYEETVVFAQIICFLFLIIYIGLDALLISKNFVLNDFDFSFQQKDKFFLAALLFMFAALIIPFFEVWSKFGISFLGGFGFEDRREGLGFLSSFLLGYGMKLVAVLGIAFWVVRKKIYFSLVVLVFFLIFVLLGGSRQPIIFVFAPLVANFCFKSKRPFLTLVVSFFALYTFSGVFDVLIYLRNLDGFEARVLALENFGATLQEAFLRPDTASIRFAFYYFIQQGSDLEGFFEFSYMRRMALFWLPSFLDFFGIKPEDFEYTMFYHYMMGREGTSHPTVFGSIYADSGPLFFIWVLVLFFINMFLLQVLSKLRGVHYLTIWTVVAGSSIMWARGALYGPVVVIFFSFIFCFFVSIFYDFFSGRKVKVA